MLVFLDSVFETVNQMLVSIFDAWHTDGLPLIFYNTSYKRLLTDSRYLTYTITYSTYTITFDPQVRRAIDNMDRSFSKL